VANNGNGPPDGSGDAENRGGGPGDQRYVVGTASKSANADARGRADKVHRELEFGEDNGAVAGKFPKPVREALERRPDVRYVEPDGLMHAIGETIP
jgi:subtilisin